MKKVHRKKGFKGYFITGLLVVVPLYLTVYVLTLIVRFMDSLVNILPRILRPDTYLPFHLPGQGIVFTVLGVFVVGVLTTNFFGQKLLGLTDRLMARVPLLSTVYNSSKQLLETFLSKEHEGFRKVVLVEFPRKGVHSMGFITGRTTGELKEKASAEATALNIFVPTTPNPTSGYYIVAKESEVIALDMSVEDAFKVLMSGGMITPDYDSDADLDRGEGPADDVEQG
jgi:uncharacterized membrane protein